MRFIGFGALAAVWLWFSYSLTYIAFGQGFDSSSCRRVDARVRNLETDWWPPRYTCVYQRVVETRVVLPATVDAERKCRGRGRTQVFDENTPDRFTCLHTQWVGLPFSVDEHVEPAVTEAVGVVFGVVPAAVLVWLGLGRPPLRRRSRSATQTAGDQ